MLEHDATSINRRARDTLSTDMHNGGAAGRNRIATAGAAAAAAERATCATKTLEALAGSSSTGNKDATSCATTGSLIADHAAFRLINHVVVAGAQPDEPELGIGKHRPLRRHRRRAGIQRPPSMVSTASTASGAALQNILFIPPHLPLRPPVRTAFAPGHFRRDRHVWERRPEA
ncbi:hypothetical protein [Rugamonas sp.]|uniref:hypothetical protein n=1 Tax=Rugamonas sp. TaxID=1926287 RepID=UPI0025DA9A3D|nr:hypothetical protein [Rugamonas sp.]